MATKKPPDLIEMGSHSNGEPGGLLYFRIALYGPKFN